MLLSMMISELKAKKEIELLKIKIAIQGVKKQLQINTLIKQNYPAQHRNIHNTSTSMFYTHSINHISKFGARLNVQLGRVQNSILYMKDRSKSLIAAPEQCKTLTHNNVKNFTILLEELMPEFLSHCREIIHKRLFSLQVYIEFLFLSMFRS